MMAPSHLDDLEIETIFILREVAFSCPNPVVLYSLGKDSSILLHLIKKAFAPGPIPFPFLHIDTSYKFEAMYEFREKIIEQESLNFFTYRNELALKEGTNPFKTGLEDCCKQLKTDALLQALKKYSWNTAISGSRRDEEKSRAKERIFSLRDTLGQWDPLNQPPEVAPLFNTLLNEGDSFRVFPLANWTELDVWLYIEKEEIEVSSLYFSQRRDLIQMGNSLVPTGPIHKNIKKNIINRPSRFRSLGCYPCSGAVLSEAQTVPEIINEIYENNYSERFNRLIDQSSDASMEAKKRQGYF